MTSKSQGLKDRTETFAINVVKFCETLPNSMAGRRIGEQLLDSGTSVASNYRAACRAFTRPLFVSKLAIVAEEADESEFWFGVILKTALSESSTATTLRQEASELTAIFTASLAPPTSTIFNNSAMVHCPIFIGVRPATRGRSQAN